jgi:hypothetical protein
MSSWPRHLWDFLIALARRWGVLMTGGFIVGLITLYQYLTARSISGWPVWAGLALSLSAAVFLTWREERLTVEKLSAEIATPLIPDDLITVFHGRTTIQGMKLCQIYFNKWITVSGSIENIFMNGRRPFAATVVTFAASENKAGVSMLFGRKWKEPLSVLRVGDEIKVRGQIEEIDAVRVLLRNCEPLDFQTHVTP